MQKPRKMSTEEIDAEWARLMREVSQPPSKEDAKRIHELEIEIRRRGI